MPSVEILVEEPIENFELEVSDYQFEILAETPPVSHREPSIWQGFFDQTGGCLIHLGEPRFKEDHQGWFFAYELLDWNEDGYFRFKTQYVNQIFELLDRLLTQSKVHRVHFTNDWQFGHEEPLVLAENLPLERFIALHHEMGIRFNSRFTIVLPMTPMGPTR